MRKTSLGVPTEITPDSPPKFPSGSSPEFYENFSNKVLE